MTQDMKTDSWDGITLEDAIRHAVRTCTLDEIAQLIRMLPESKREFYRKVVKDEVSKMRAT